MVGTTRISRIRYHFCEDKIPSLNDSLKFGAFADCNKETAESKSIKIPTVPNLPFPKLFGDRISPDKNSQDSDTMDNNVLNDSKNEQTQKQDSEKKNKEQNGNATTPNSLAARLGDMVLSSKDDFIMVDLKTPFATSTEKVELSRIYREWQTAPPLQEFDDLPPLESLELSKQLETFESDLTEYDSLVQLFCQTSPNNN